MMKYIYACAISTLMTLTITTNSYAQWIFQTQENAFEPTKNMHIALTASDDGYAFGLRCQGNEKSLIFLTNEKIDDANAINTLKPELLVRIDKNEILTFPAVIQSRENKLSAIVINDEKISKVFDEGKNARTRISVAIKMLSETYHPTNFNVRGSTKSITKLNNNCGEN